MKFIEGRSADGYSVMLVSTKYGASVIRTWDEEPAAPVLLFAKFMMILGCVFG